MSNVENGDNADASPSPPLNPSQLRLLVCTICCCCFCVGCVVAGLAVLPKRDCVQYRDTPTYRCAPEDVGCDSRLRTSSVKEDCYCHDCYERSGMSSGLCATPTFMKDGGFYHERCFCIYYYDSDQAKNMDKDYFCCPYNEEYECLAWTSAPITEPGYILLMVGGAFCLLCYVTGCFYVCAFDGEKKHEEDGSNEEELNTFAGDLSANTLPSISTSLAKESSREDSDVVADVANTLPSLDPVVNCVSRGDGENQLVE